jgi:hypothetical protein
MSASRGWMSGHVPSIPLLRLMTQPDRRDPLDTGEDRRNCGIASLASEHLLDDFVCQMEHGRRQPDTEFVGGLLVDDQLEPHRLLNWNVGRLSAF